jgi:hypothetical protein
MEIQRKWFPVKFNARGLFHKVYYYKALRYKSEGPGIDSRCRRGFSRDI